MKKLLSFLIVAFILLFTTTVWANSTITFTWNPNSETDLAGYRLYQTDVAGQYEFGESHAVAIIPVGTETITIENISDGEKWWVLTAYDNTNNESNRSNEVTAILDSTAPIAPETLDITIIVNVNVN